MATVYGKDVYLSNSFVYASLTWCFMTSIMGVCVLLFLRSLVVTTFYAVNSRDEERHILYSKESFMIRVVENVEQFFAVGSLVGVGISWTVTDLVLGMQSHIFHSVLTVGVALIWCKFAMKHSSMSSSSCDNDDEATVDSEQDDEEDTESLLGKELVIQVV